MLKKLILVTLVILMVLNTSCTSRNTSKNESTISSAEKVELIPESNDLVAMFGTLFVTKPSDAVLNAFAREFPDFKVSKSEGNTTGDFANDLTTLAGMIASNDTPDVFSSFMAPVVAYYTDMFMPLQSYIDKDPDFHLDEYDEQAFKITTYNEKVYFAPLDYTTQILAYNKDMFENAGMSSDKPPATWSEYFDYASKLAITEGGKVTTIGMDPNNFRWDFWYISSYGKHYVDKTGLRCEWNTPEFIEVLEFAKSFPKTFGGYKMLDGGWWWYLFGNVVMGDLSANGLSILKDTQFKTGIARLPVPDGSNEYHSAAR